MPTNYQPKKDNPYRLPDGVHMQMVHLINSYPGLIDRREEVLHGNPPPPDGQPKGKGTGNPTQEKALVLSVLNSQIQGISQVIIELTGKYSNAYSNEEFEAYEAFKDYVVFCYYRSKPGKDEAPCKKTWYRYRREFTYKLAKRLNYF